MATKLSFLFHRTLQLFSSTTWRSGAARLSSSCKQGSNRHYCSAPDAKGDELLQQRSHCNVGTIGHVDHGKTTLTAAITKVLSKVGQATFTPYDKIDIAPQERLRGITINVAHVGYRTKLRQYAHTDCPGHLDFVKNMIAGASQMDAAILLVAATDGQMPQTCEHLLVAKQMGVNKIIVYVNKVELVDDDVKELVEMEIRELLDSFGYDGANSPFVFGSALLALKGDESSVGEGSIHRLMAVLDEYVDIPHRDLKSPFLLHIDNFMAVPNRGTVVVGTLKRGVMKKGQEAELLGFDKKLKTTIGGIQIFHSTVLECQAGQNVGVLVRGVKRTALKRGMVLAARRSLTLHNRFEATLYLLSKSEGGRHRPMTSHYTQQLHAETWNVSCRFDLPDGIDMMMPGEQGLVFGTLMDQMVLLPGQVFTIRENNNMIATGKIIKTLPSVEVPYKRLEKVDFSRVITRAKR